MTRDKPQHVNPGCDTTVNPIVIDNSYRDKRNNGSTEPQHCDHECVCWLFPEDAIEPCNHKCEHDTRTRSPNSTTTPIFALPKDTTTNECINEGLNALSDYFNAALDGGENKEALCRMWKQQMGILSTLLKNYQMPSQILGIKGALSEYQAYEKGFSDGKREHDAAIAAQARGDVLKELDDKLFRIGRLAHECILNYESNGFCSEIETIVESLRSEVKK